MPSLSRDNRKLLENTVVAARAIAERGAEKSLISLGIGQREPPDSLTQQERILRNQLRAHGRQLGDNRHPSGVQETRHLAQAVAYEHWHRMLFARFLAEHDLLIHPAYGIAMSMDEVREGAREQGVDWLTLAMDCAQQMLIEVFRADDPVLNVVLPPETRLELEQKLEQLPADVFEADDSLGWVYQFWQTEEKERVNESEVKIGTDELSPVTQLFTEDYMVLFLLPNTLGAWWTAKRRAEGKSNELRDHEWIYLRLNEDGSPAAGSFNSWPTQLSELRILDPCMGSGHFLAFALPILAKMAETEYALTPGEAVHSVLIRNLYGLELDARCSQIAAFNLALTAWRYVGRYTPLPPMNLACSGLGINASEGDWVRFAGADGRKQDLMVWLYSLFSKAPTLGSLIDPVRVGKRMVEQEIAGLLPLLEAALRKETASEETRELAVAAKGVLAAFRVLSSEFTLVATNVPYLGRGKQDAVLAQYCAEFHGDAKADLATCFVDRCLRFCHAGGSAALVTPQNWLFLTTYSKMRERLLKHSEWTVVVKLGPAAFRDMNWWAANTSLLVFTHKVPSPDHLIVGTDVSEPRDPAVKAELLTNKAVSAISQASQLRHPDCRILLSALDDAPLLEQYASCFQGVSPADFPRYGRFFWEVDLTHEWRFWQGTVDDTVHYGGRELVLWWNDGLRDAVEAGSAFIRGEAAWGKSGVVVRQMRHLPCTLYAGDVFDTNCAVISPHNEEHLLPIWTFCSSEEYSKAVRQMDQKTNVTNATLVKVPFDLGHWQRVSAARYPNGLPPPHSTDPTQWIFDGHPKGSKYPLQVAVARLVGYRWPRQTGSTFPGCPALKEDGLEAHSAADGIVCLSSLAGEAPAAERLRALLAAAYGEEWSAAKLAGLLGNNQSLEEWLRDRFFEEHCQIFYQRPFVWHVWDGRKDGFHALVNCHNLVGPNGEALNTLEKLIYTSLGDWISRQRAGVTVGEDGAEARLTAAMHLKSELEKILEGDSPFDVFVRWKPLRKQAIGWDPDLSDGVRVNLRPWLVAKPYQASRVDACVLRVTPIKLPLGKDRGKEPSREKDDFPWFADSQDRTNDVHLTLDEKRKAREQRKP